MAAFTHFSNEKPHRRGKASSSSLALFSNVERNPAEVFGKELSACATFLSTVTEERKASEGDHLAQSSLSFWMQLLRPRVD